MNNRVITRDRGAIPAPGPDSHMMEDRLGQPWTHSPSDADQFIAGLHQEVQQSRIARGADPETGLKVVALRRGSEPVSMKHRVKKLKKQGRVN
jgi:hypothetical protein